MGCEGLVMCGRPEPGRLEACGRPWLGCPQAREAHAAGKARGERGYRRARQMRGGSVGQMQCPHCKPSLLQAPGGTHQGRAARA